MNCLDIIVYGEYVRSLIKYNITIVDLNELSLCKEGTACSLYF
jgi:hypothetical protein